MDDLVSKEFVEVKKRVEQVSRHGQEHLRKLVKITDRHQEKLGEHDSRIAITEDRTSKYEQDYKDIEEKWARYDRNVTEIQLMLEGFKGKGGLVDKVDGIDKGLVSVKDSVGRLSDTSKKMEDLEATVNKFLHWGGVIVGVITVLNLVFTYFAWLDK
jgi:hypothetical protein